MQYGKWSMHPVDATGNITDFTGHLFICNHWCVWLKCKLIRCQLIAKEFATHHIHSSIPPCGAYIFNYDYILSHCTHIVTHPHTGVTQHKNYYNAPHPHVFTYLRAGRRAIPLPPKLRPRLRWSCPPVNGVRTAWSWSPPPHGRYLARRRIRISMACPVIDCN